jgi:hypothetical protein
LLAGVKHQEIAKIARFALGNEWPLIAHVNNSTPARQRHQQTPPDDEQADHSGKQLGDNPLCME